MDAGGGQVAHGQRGVDAPFAGHVLDDRPLAEGEIHGLAEFGERLDRVRERRENGRKMS